MAKSEKEKSLIEAVHKAEQAVTREEEAFKALKTEAVELRDLKDGDKVAAAKRINEIGEGTAMKNATGLILVKLAEIDKARVDLEKAQQALKAGMVEKHGAALKGLAARVNAQLKEEARFRKDVFRTIYYAERDGVKWQKYLNLHFSLQRDGHTLMGYIGRLPIVYGEGQDNQGLTGQKARWHFNTDNEITELAEKYKAEKIAEKKHEAAKTDNR